MPRSECGVPDDVPSIDERSVAAEVFEVYRFLRATAVREATRARLMRAAVLESPYGCTFRGRLSVAALASIDHRLQNAPRTDPCLNVHAVRLYGWLDTVRHLFATPATTALELWELLRHRNEHALVTHAERLRIEDLTERGMGTLSYALAGIELLCVDVDVLRLSGSRARIAREAWRKMAPPKPCGHPGG